MPDYAAIVSRIDSTVRDAAESATALQELTDLCDYYVTKDAALQHRVQFGKIQAIFQLLVDDMGPEVDSTFRVAACKALGFLCFNNLSNSVTVSKIPGFPKALTDMMFSESDDEQEWAAGAIANICVNDGSDSARVALAKSQSVIKGLKKLCLSSNGQVKLRAVGAINNLSRSREAVKLLEENGVVDLALGQIIQSRGSGDDHDVLVARALMAAANIIGREENNEIITGNPERLKTIVRCLDVALNDTNRAWAGVIWTVPLVLFPLFNLSVSDANKKPLIDAGLMNSLFKLIGGFDPENALDEEKGIGMVELGLHTVYNMVFSPAAKQWIQQNNGEDILRNLADLNPDRSFRAQQSAKDVIANIFWELGLDSKGRTRDAKVTKKMQKAKQSEKGKERSTGKWVMVSYNWSHQNKVKQITDRLIETGIPVWMDILPGCMEGHTLEAMADAVGNASVVIVFVTRKYKESANCRRECSYAQDLHKPIIPVILEENYQMDGSWGWLGLILAGRKWIDFSDESLVDIKTSELIGGIASATQTSGAGAQATDKNIVPLPVEVQTWMENEGLGDHISLFAKHELRSLSLIRTLAERDMYRLALPVGHRIKLSMLVENRLKPLQDCDEDMESVRNWLEDIGLEKYYDVFQFQRVNCLKFAGQLSEVDIDHMIAPIGHRVVIRNAVAKIPGKNTSSFRKKRQSKSYFGSLFSKS